MKINGRDCSIVIKAAHQEIDVPYSEETIREDVLILREEAAIEGNGNREAIIKKAGVTGCVVTPLTIETSPLLFNLAMGSLYKHEFVSETRNIYRCQLSLSPMEDTDYFDLIQDRGNERKLFEGCRVQGFELRFEREQAIKLKLDIRGEKAASPYSRADTFKKVNEERFNGNHVDYLINGIEYHNIYGLTIAVKKDGGTKTELWIRRSLLEGKELPENIEELTISARLSRDKYEYNNYGLFSVTLKKLTLVSDETNVNSVDTVIGPLRYYVSGNVSADVFSASMAAREGR